MRKVHWGILSTARIGLEQVIPAMQRSKYCDVAGIASRSLEKAQEVASLLGIRAAYGSYEELLAAPDIEAVYIPLPNHLHVPWSIKALDAGKHVLCEKPIALTVNEAQELLIASRKNPRLKVMEAFMYRHHPQWLRARELVVGGGIGDLRTIQSFFSYFNADPLDIRNIAEIGGGGLMDVGCYCISLSRFMFGIEPSRVVGIMEFDSEFKTDRLASGMLDFGIGTSTFTCGTKLTSYQRVNLFGTEGRIEIEIPFNPMPSEPVRIWHQRGGKTDEIVLDACDQYTIQGDMFSLAVLRDVEVPVPLDDAVSNMKVIGAIAQSAASGTWVLC